MRFNERFLRNIMYLGHNPVFHIADQPKKFSIDKFLPSISSNDICQTFFKCWSSTYNGLLSLMMIDQGRKLGQSKAFYEMATIYNVTLKKTGVEVHNTLGLSWRYHQTLRNTYHKLLESYLSQDKSLLLQLAVKDVNDILGSEGLLPSALLFGKCSQA